MIEKFFYPVRIDVSDERRRFSGNIVQHKSKFPDTAGFKIALFGVYDNRLGGAEQKDAQTAFTEQRNELYSLYYKFPGLTMVDLGNIIPGETADDTLYAVRTVVNELASQNVVSVILGNHQLAGVGQYAAFDDLSRFTEVTVFDNKVSINEEDLVYRIVSHEPNHLFNLNHMGYQTYLCDEEALMAFEKMYFDTVRLGVLRGNPDITEPSLRNSKVCVFDLACIKYADALGSPGSTPNGISAEEACQIARYAGISPRLQSIGFYGLSNSQVSSAQLIAQMIWYFAEGVSLRKDEDPVKEQEKFLQYRTALNEGQHEIVFYKSKTTARWWMEIPHPKNHKENTFPIVVPCSYADYQVACNNEMPDRWWRVFQKYT